MNRTARRATCGNSTMIMSERSYVTRIVRTRRSSPKMGKPSSSAAAADVLETAFADSAVFDGTFYRIEPGISRKKVLVPAITDVLESYPKE